MLATIMANGVAIILISFPQFVHLHIEYSGEIDICCDMASGFDHTACCTYGCSDKVWIETGNEGN